MEKIREADWKVFKQLRQQALQRMCQEIVDGAREIIEQPDKTAHERFLALFRHINERNEDVAIHFDHFSRSRALCDLSALRGLNLITEEEARELSPDAQQRTRPRNL